MELNHNNSYKLLYEAPSPPIKTHASSDSTLPIFAIVVPSILATLFIVISYITLVTKCCSNNWQRVNPFRWIFSTLRARQQEDPFIAFSPIRMLHRGLDESTIREIPTFQFTKGGDKDRSHQSVYACVVCLTEFQEQEMLKVLPNCNHAFHLDCIDIWLQTNANCPLCRSSISGNNQCPIDHIIAPSSSPQDSSQLLSNMGSDEDFVVIELGGEGMPQIQQERNVSRENISRTHSRRKMELLKPRKCHNHHVSIMGDECINVRKKDDQFSIQPIRRSFSMDSANDRQVYMDVQTIIQQNRQQNEASASDDCNSRGRRSFFPFLYGRGSKIGVLPLENEV